MYPSISLLSFLPLLLIGSAFSIAFDVFIALAVYEDTKTIGLKNGTVWVILAALIPISALIYLAVRNSAEKTVPKMCAGCGATMPPNTPYCTQCGSPNLINYRVADEETHKKKRKTYLIIALCFYAVSIIFTTTATTIMTREIINSQKNGDYRGYYNFYSDEFSDEFSDDFNKDFDEFFDEFNNFGN